MFTAGVIHNRRLGGGEFIGRGDLCSRQHHTERDHTGGGGDRNKQGRNPQQNLQWRTALAWRRTVITCAAATATGWSTSAAGSAAFARGSTGSSTRGSASFCRPPGAAAIRCLGAETTSRRAGVLRGNASRIGRSAGRGSFAGARLRPLPRCRARCRASTRGRAGARSPLHRRLVAHVLTGSGKVTVGRATPWGHRCWCDS